jgi:hypothetical protein
VTEHDVHVVLGEKYGRIALARALRDEAHESTALTCSHARRRLVHEQEARIIDKRDRQFDAFQIAIR